MYIKFTRAMMKCYRHTTNSEMVEHKEVTARYVYNPVLTVLFPFLSDKYLIGTPGDGKDIFFYYIDKPFDSQIEAETELQNILSAGGEKWL